MDQKREKKNDKWKANTRTLRRKRDTQIHKSKANTNGRGGEIGERESELKEKEEEGKEGRKEGQEGR